MAEKLSILALRAVDALAQVLILQELLEIAIEQGEKPLELRSPRVSLLLNSYLSLVSPHLDEIERQLEEIRALALSRAEK